MHAALELLRGDREARLFFLAHAQSSLGTGAAIVGLLLVAYERFHSPWAISLVLVADLAPAVVLGPLFGAAADRWSRRGCAVAADLVRAGAFVGVAMVDSFEATVVFALVAGAGTGLFRPAILAGLPSLVPPSRLPAATSLYGAISTADVLLGPALGALVLLLGPPEVLLLANAATFALSAAILGRLRFGGRAEPEEGQPPGSLLAEARAGLRATARMPGVRAVVMASSAILLFAGLFNVAELVFARELGADDAGFAILVASFGLGIVAGSLSGIRSVGMEEARRAYLLGFLALAAGFAASAAAPTYAAALLTFFVAGAGNGLIAVNERLLIQRTVPDGLMGRVFGTQDALASALFTVAFLGAGGLLSLVGPRVVLLLSGIGALVVWAGASRALRNGWHREQVDEPLVPVSKMGEATRAG